MEFAPLKWLRKRPQATTKPGQTLSFDHPVSCRMANGVYLQADGSLPCYCSGGITKILGKTHGADFMRFYNGETMRALRSELARGVFPWQECSACHVKTLRPTEPPAIEPSEISILHIEPTSICNLRCPGCHATEVMEKRAPGRRAFYPLDEFKALIDSLTVPVKAISFCGYGEPLLNVDVPKMIAYAKSQLNPSPSCSIDTNANIRHLDVEELIASRVNLIRFALDGAFQENYEQYRRRGKLKVAHDFIRRVAVEKQRQKAASVKLVWKYVIFEHSSSIAELEAAIRFCSEVGIAFDYSRAAGILAGAKRREELVPQIRELLERYGVPDVIGGTPRKTGIRFGEEDAWKYAVDSQ
jgi:pyruvate-formate lyase-activating enzyme